MGLDISIYRVVNGTVEDFYRKFDEKMNYYEKEEKILNEVFNHFIEDNKEKIEKLIEDVKIILNDDLNEKRLKSKLFTLTNECQKHDCKDSEEKEMIKWNVFNYFGILKTFLSDIPEEKKDEVINKMIEVTKELIIRDEDKKAIKDLEKEEEKIGDHNDMLDEVAYFRKYNHLVAWVDKNVQEVGNCDYIKITREQLQQLLNDAKEALKAYQEDDFEKIEEIMPTTSGCFFGDTEYDDYYERKIKNTIKQVEDILNTYPDKEFIFQADW